MKKFKMKLKTAMKILLLAVFLSIIAIYSADRTIVGQAEPYLYDQVERMPENKVGLLLGCAKTLGNGRKNMYFYHRIEATVELYKAGKIKYIVISGDNSRSNYNESQDMKDELVKSGIPDSVIHLDYAGFRTLDSVVRMNKIFGQTQFTVISQKFHNERAVYIAHKKGLSASGYNAQDVSRKAGLKTNIREKFARVKVFVDLLLNKQPKFLGEKISIG